MKRTTYCEKKHTLRLTEDEVVAAVRAAHPEIPASASVVIQERYSDEILVASWVEYDTSDEHPTPVAPPTPPPDDATKPLRPDEDIPF